MALERLQKILARSGLASRRQAEEWITQGRVAVNAEVVRELGSKADPARDRIEVDGRPLRPPQPLTYLALHKPRKCVTTRSDPQGRATVMDLLPKVPGRVYPVGRLDYHSEGLLLVTNDGDFAHWITSAASHITKTYWVKVKGKPDEKKIEKLREGVWLAGRRTLPARIRFLRPASPRTVGSRSPEALNSWYEVTLREGRQNQIRRMFARIGHPVQKLKRIRIGEVSLGNLPAGSYRPLTPAEVRLLKNPTASHERD